MARIAESKPVFIYPTLIANIISRKAAKAQSCKEL
jgi:hypothetical protein